MYTARIDRKNAIAMLGVAVTSVIGGYITVKFIAPRFFQLIERVATEATVGIVFQIGIVYVTPLLIAIWGGLLVRGRFITVLGFQILLLPLSARAQRLIGIEAYQTPGGSVQMVSLTTFMIVGLYIVMLVSRVPMRREDRYFRVAEFLLLGFAFAGTVSQFVNHTPWSAFWLSLGGLWQFIIWFYVISALIRTPDDIRYLLKCIVLTMLISIAFRIMSRQDTFLVMGSESVSNLGDHAFLGLDRYVRIGSPTFGPPPYYGGYVALVIFLSIYFIRTSQTKSSRVFWLLSTALLLFEMLNTFTRGATLSLLALGLLLLFKSQRQFVKRSIKIGLLFSPILIRPLWQLTFYRGRSPGMNILQDVGILGRWQLLGLHLPRFFDNLGFGYGIKKSLEFVVPQTGLLRPAHNFILALSQSVGAISTTFFLAVFFLCPQSFV